MSKKLFLLALISLGMLWACKPRTQEAGLKDFADLLEERFDFGFLYDLAKEGSPHSSVVNVMAVDPFRERFVFTGDASGVLGLTAVETGQAVKLAQFDKGITAIDVAFFDDSYVVALGLESGKTYIKTVAVPINGQIANVGNEEFFELPKFHSNEVTGISVATDGMMVASASIDGGIIFHVGSSPMTWFSKEAFEKDLRYRDIKPPGSTGENLAIGAGAIKVLDNRNVAVGRGRQVELWNVVGKRIEKFETQGRVTALDFASNGDLSCNSKPTNVVAVGTDEGNVHVVAMEIDTTADSFEQKLAQIRSSGGKDDYEQILKFLIDRNKEVASDRQSGKIPGLREIRDPYADLLGSRQGDYANALKRNEVLEFRRPPIVMESHNCVTGRITRTRSDGSRYTFLPGGRDDPSRYGQIDQWATSLDQRSRFEPNKIVQLKGVINTSQESITDISFAKGRWGLLTSGNRGTLVYWDLYKRKAMRKLFLSNSGGIDQIGGFSSSRRAFLVGSGGTKVKVWDVEMMNSAIKLGESSRRVEFDNSGRYLINGSEKSIKVIDMNSLEGWTSDNLKTVAEKEMPAPISDMRVVRGSVVSNSSTMTILTGHCGNSAYLWEANGEGGFEQKQDFSLKRLAEIAASDAKPEWMDEAKVKLVQDTLGAEQLACRYSKGQLRTIATYNSQYAFVFNMVKDGEAGKIGVISVWSLADGKPVSVYRQNGSPGPYQITTRYLTQAFGLPESDELDIPVSWLRVYKDRSEDGVYKGSYQEHELIMSWSPKGERYNNGAGKRAGPFLVYANNVNSVFKNSGLNYFGRNQAAIAHGNIQNKPTMARIWATTPNGQMIVSDANANTYAARLAQNVDGYFTFPIWFGTAEELPLAYDLAVRNDGMVVSTGPVGTVLFWAGEVFEHRGF